MVGKSFLFSLIKGTCVHFQEKQLCKIYFASLLKRAHTKWKELTPCGSKFFPFRVNPFSAGNWCVVKQTESHKYSFVVQSILVISTSLISNNRISRSENLVPVLTWISNNRYQNIVEKRKEQFLLFSTIFSTYLLTSGIKLHIHLLNVAVRFIVFVNPANLICRGADISKYSRESIGLRDKESRLYCLWASYYFEQGQILCLYFLNIFSGHIMSNFDVGNVSNCCLRITMGITCVLRYSILSYSSLFYFILFFYSLFYISVFLLNSSLIVVYIKQYIGY